MALRGIALENLTQKQKEPSALDKISQGLNMAQSIIGSVGGVSDIMSKIDARRAAEAKAGELKQLQGKGGATQETYQGALKEGRAAFSPTAIEGYKPLEGGGFTKIEEKGPSSLDILAKEATIRNTQESILGRKEDRQIRAEDKDIKRQEKIESLTIPGYGVARNEQDAKDLKEALVAQKDVQSTLDRLIEIRESKGAEAWDRETVAEAKRLAADAKIANKSIAKLGVMSDSDSILLNKLVPEDPTAWSGASLLGQDPILAGLKQFKNEQTRKFENNLAVRLKSGNKEAPKANSPKVPDLTPQDIEAEMKKRGLK